MAAGLVLGWFLLAYVVPPALKLMRPGRTKTILRNVTGYLTGGLLFHDAKKKIPTQKP
jgi:hypothetical protein